MGLQGDDGEVLAGDPIPAAPGQAATGNFFSGEGNSAIVGDENLWDGLIVEPETVFVQEPTPEPEPSTEPVEEPKNTEAVETAISINPTNYEDKPLTTEEEVPMQAIEDESVSEETSIVEIVEQEEKEEQPRDTIFETKTVTVIEYDNVTPVVAPKEEEGNGNRTVMIIIVASIIGVLLAVIIAMVVRVSINKRKNLQVPVLVKDEVLTNVIEVEPQFVLAADDSKNIFGRPSTSPLTDAIEGSENKKPGTAASGEGKKRKKKTVLRKRKTDTASRPGTSGSGSQQAAIVREADGEDSVDDGFRNYDNNSQAPDSASKVFNETGRSSGWGADMSTRKLNVDNIPLERVD